MKRSDGFGCDRCCGEDALAAWRWPRESAERLLDENHFSVSVETCRECGQAFVRIYTEFIDSEGDDPQYWDLMPITDAEREVLRGQTGRPSTNYLMSLGSHRRHLKADDHGVRWDSGGLIVMRGG